MWRGEGGGGRECDRTARTIGCTGPWLWIGVVINRKQLCKQGGGRSHFVSNGLWMVKHAAFQMEWASNLNLRSVTPGLWNDGFNSVSLLRGNEKVPCILMCNVFHVHKTQNQYLTCPAEVKKDFLVLN